MTDGVFFLKFTIGLLDQLHDVDIGHIQLDISGAGPGGLHQILGQRLKALGFLVQDLKIFLDRGILGLFALDEIYIVDDGGQRRLNIVGYVGDQVCL